MRLTFKEVLVYYDEPQVVVALDPVETLHLCILVENKLGRSTYCCVPVSISRLASFKSGDLDLRTAFLTRETLRWYEASIVSVDQDVLDAIERNLEIPDAYLPEAGFVLEHDAVADLISEVARSRSSVVVEMNFDPPEAAYHKMSARTLSAALYAMQQILKYSQAQIYKLSKSSAPTDAYVMDVLAFTPGSFSVQLAPRASIDLFGSSDIENALCLIETLFERVSNPDSAIDAFSKYRGHLVRSIVELLSILSTSHSNLGFSWATPTSSRARSARITKKDAAHLLGILARHEELSVERIAVSGPLTKADDKTGAWRVLDESSGAEIHGKIRKGSNASLVGLVIKKRYRIDCEEEYHQDQISGRDIRRLYAVEFTQL